MGDACAVRDLNVRVRDRSRPVMIELSIDLTRRILPNGWLSGVRGLVRSSGVARAVRT